MRLADFWASLFSASLPPASGLTAAAHSKLSTAFSFTVRPTNSARSEFAQMKYSQMSDITQHKVVLAPDGPLDLAVL